MSYLENAKILRAEIDRHRAVLGGAEDSGQYRVEVVAGDKLGSEIVNHWVGGSIAYSEYREVPNAPGTAENPIPWAPELALIPGAYYTYEGVRKVWWGAAGICAAWEHPDFVVF